jgi:hypothetical protein
VEQEAAARRAEPVEAPPTLKRLMDLREQINRLQLTVDALPTKPLARFDEVDAKVRDLSAKRSEHEERLAALGQPATRFGRERDPHAQERAFLRTAIEIDVGALADLAAERGRLQRELGDPDQVRFERDGIESALSDLRRDHDLVRDVLVQRDVEREPSWLTGALGKRPAGSRESETWDQAARAVARFRLDHDIIDTDAPLGPEPAGAGDDRRARDHVKAALERAQRLLGREPADHDRGVDVGIG